MDNYSLGYPSDVPSQIPTRGSPLGSAWGKRMMEGGRHGTCDDDGTWQNKNPPPAELE